ncbi:MAG TPA: ATP-binding protein [Bdellovibrionota bacterium]
MRAGLKAKVLLSFALLALLVLLAFGYGAFTFRGLEERMRVVNDVHVPAIRALNQVESSLFLLESDLDKGLAEGMLRPKDALESVLLSRIDQLERLAKSDSGRSEALQSGVPSLRSSYQTLADLLAKIYLNWQARRDFEEDLSAKRSDFRLRMKTLIRDIDRESRAVSLSVEAELRWLSLMLSLVLGLCCIAAVWMSFWLARSVRPLEALVLFMRDISQKGLSEKSIQGLANLPESSDEIGTLSRESYKMASSILDNQKVLQDQKMNLERAHQELARQNEVLRSTQNKLAHSEKLGLVGRMAAQMAHEIRNPLNALSLHTEILEDQLRSDPEALESLSPLRREINKLISVTESYLDLARGPRLQKSAVKLKELIEELHELYQPVLKEKGIFFTCDLGDVPAVPVDRPQITQVVGNLIKNASEAFSDLQRPGKRYIRIMTAFNPLSREATITVMDNGAGIPLELQKNIFSPFYTNKAEGTGLGLTFSRQVVEAHGGEISFDSAPNQGTKFTIRLPLAEASVQAWGTTAVEGSAWKHTGQTS